MDNDDVRSIAENDQLKEEAYRTYATWLLMKRDDLLVLIEALEDGPAETKKLPEEAIDFICEMAAVTLRDFAERQLQQGV